MEDIMTLLCHSMKLERDRGVNELQKFLFNAKFDELKNLQSCLENMLSKNSDCWQEKLGLLLGIKAYLPYLKKSLEDESTSQFIDKVMNTALDLLTDDEVRVRLESGEVLGGLCELLGTTVYEKCKDKVLSLIKNNLERDTISDASSRLPDNNENERKCDDLMKQTGRDASQIFHDTAGWKCLETSMKCLQAMIDGCGPSFQMWINQELLDLLFQALKHTNRFVRETGFYVLGSLVSCGSVENGDNKIYHNPFKSTQFGHQISHEIGLGLSDNWSQVRLASSEAARKFLLSFNNEEEREVFYPVLLPRMCLNRYYVADGVRIYSQETWRRIAKTEGRELVQKYINPVVEYYVSQTKANNHAVREAACACIAELASKIKQDAVRPHVPCLLSTLLECFQDESWPVRDAACLACGNFVMCYPEESRFSMESLYPMFFRNLHDCISSVRQGAATALANVVQAYGTEAFSIVSKEIEKGLNSVENQPSESEKYASFDKGLSTFSVVKKLRDNDMELHTNKQMYSCGSLAPKMGRGGGCSDHKFYKPSEPWEFADGCIHLVAVLSQNTAFSKQIIKFLDLITKAVSYRHYTHHLSLLETLCQQLPNIARGIGKKAFKLHLEKFLDDIFYSLSSENPLTSSAASQCLNQLSTFLGPSILRARVEQHNPQFLQQLDANSHIAGL
ncbi:uncharacterized protein [Centruroides vittatus]|uniref:uncharacterized protein n=1 Tax=Centruroides vittatus TaxID=120091 RepID=UPI0035100DA8